MSQEITIRESHYYTYQDEKRFYEWLEAIPGVERVVGTPKGLAIHIVASGLSIDDWADLAALFIRYSIDMSHLRALINLENESWIKDATKFWYEPLFE
jgi:hypothetical protein